MLAQGMVCKDDVPSFHRIHYGRHDASVFLYAFELIELDACVRRDNQDERPATIRMRMAPGVG